MRHVHALSLGAGVQSTTLAALFEDGDIQQSAEAEVPGAPVSLDAAIFSDTQAEPAAVYAHLAWLISEIKRYPILVRTKSSLKEDLLRGENSTKQRFASIPAFTKGEGDKREGRLRRQCSKEYKTDVIEKCIRQDLLGLKPRQRYPKDVIVHSYIGISLDEAGRAWRMIQRMRKQEPRFGKTLFLHYPLIEKGWNRAACRAYLEKRIPSHRVPRRSCTFCPNRQDSEWIEMKEQDPESWQEAVEVDRALREPGRIMHRGLNNPLYLHRSCQPLELVQLTPAKDPREHVFSQSMSGECEGICEV